jgi:Flp pilus assembly protein TadD
MNPHEQPVGSLQKQKRWVIALVCSVFTLAIFWSVDVSIIYILSGFSAFCLFKVWQYRKQNDPITTSDQSRERAERQGSAWDQLNTAFKTSSSPRAREKKQQVVVILGVILFFIFITIAIPAFFIDDTRDEANGLRAWANNLSQSGQYDSAAYLLGKACELDPENADLYLERGNAFLNGNKNDSALLEYDKVLMLNPQYTEAYYNRALVYFYRKQYRPAITEAKRALMVNSAYTDAMVLTGDCFYSASQSDSALVWYEQAYESGYRSASVSHIMAYINDTKGQTQKAIALYKEALQYDTTRVEIYSRLGELVQGEEGNAYRQKATRK